MPASASTICRLTKRQRTGEWRDGIGRLAGKTFPADAAALLGPYLEAVGLAEGAGTLKSYPGSPLIARRLLRKQDRLFAIELHPDDAGRLRKLFAGDVQTRVLELDGWLALGAQLPPKEKRGLVLVDPPFEQPGEFDRIADGLAKAYRRWPGGIYALWYPVKNRMEIADFRDRLGSAGIARILDIRFGISRPSPEPRLDGCGIDRGQPALHAGGRNAGRAACLARAAGRRPPRSLVDAMAGAGMRLQSLRPRSGSISYGSKGGYLPV